MEVRESFRFADYFAVCGVGKFLEPTDIRATGNPLNIRYKGKRQGEKGVILQYKQWKRRGINGPNRRLS